MGIRDRANALITGNSVADGVNWQKAIDIGLSLLVSPLAGFAIASLILLFLKWWKPFSTMHATPATRKKVIGKKHPPFWSRLILVVSAMAVSFVHGSNDGQKGIGLIMLVLIGIVPAHFVLNLDSTAYEIERTHDAVVHLNDFYQRHNLLVGDFLALGKRGETELPTRFGCDPRETEATIQVARRGLENVRDYREMIPEERISMRRYLLCLDDTARKVNAFEQLSAEERKNLAKLRHDLNVTTEYTPLWVVLAVALALGGGTMIGWRRVVETVGEKIGKQGMTYAQGMSAQMTAAGSIGIANLFSLPVSTTHVLSSGVAGTMVANRSGLQLETVRHILLAWLLTLPAAMGLSAGLYWLSTLVFTR